MIEKKISKMNNKKKIFPTHPGKILQNRFLIPLGVSQSQLARDINVSTRKINEICRGKRPITIDTAARLSLYWPVSAEFWLGIQQKYDLETFQDEEEENLRLVIRPFKQEKLNIKGVFENFL
jgi:antitoxin HigA-1